MRVALGCSLGGLGHLTPVVRAAQALASLGHHAMVLVPPSLTDAAADAGVTFRVGGEPPRPVIEQLWERVRAGPPEEIIGLLDRELFAGHCTDAMLGPAQRLSHEWRPEVFVREPCEYATAVVAHGAGTPQLQLGISQSAIEYDVLGQVSATLERHLIGVADAIASAPYLTSFPASVDRSPWPDTRRFRESVARSGELPDWWPGDQRPLVYVTFGSVLAHLPEAQDVYRVALDAVSPLPARILMTVGRAFDPAVLGPTPNNIQIERWVPQQDVFADAQLVVCHGGSGTTFGALAAGMPLVICPLFADQLANARVVEEAGAGVAFTAHNPVTGGLASLRPEHVSPLRESIVSALRDPQPARAARRLAREIEGTPPLEDVLARWLESNETP